jgi:hypothetical protein
LKEIFSTGELTKEASIRKIRTVQTEGNRQVERERAFYNLDAIDSESKVQLCNFTDVYYNWAVTKDIQHSFMTATASTNQIAIFKHQSTPGSTP